MLHKEDIPPLIYVSVCYACIIGLFVFLLYHS